MSDTKTDTPRKKRDFGVFALVAAVIAVLAILLAGRISQNFAKAEAPKISRYGMIGDFTLTDHHGQPFNRDQVDGKVWVANFIFTSCATECPLLSRRMREVQEAFAGDDRVSLVSISIDPRTDHPERLAKYASAYKAGEKWSFLTGETKIIEHLCTKGFMVTTPGSAPPDSSKPKTRQLLHSEKIAVVDQLGVVRFFANGMNPKAAQQISTAVRELLAAGG